MSSEEIQILSKFRTEEGRLNNPKQHRSNKRFRGHLFAFIVMEKIKECIPLEKYTPVLGPVWIQRKEYVEWDGAIVKKNAEDTSSRSFAASDLIALFEFKIAGIYGSKTSGKGRRLVDEVIQGIKDNFEEVRKMNNSVSCFYISLYERKPKSSDRNPIDYYDKTEKGLTGITTCMLFNSRFYKKDFKREKPRMLDSWSKVVMALQIACK